MMRAVMVMTIMTIDDDDDDENDGENESNNNRISTENKDNFLTSLFIFNYR